MGLAGKLTKALTQDVADNAVRFYRGQGPKLPHLAEMSDDMVGRYFTPHVMSAANYVNEAPHLRKLFYVDVPMAEMFERNIVSNYETVLPRDIADRARPLRKSLSQYKTRRKRIDLTDRSGSFLNTGVSSARHGLPVRTSQY